MPQDQVTQDDEFLATLPITPQAKAAEVEDGHDEMGTEVHDIQAAVLAGLAGTAAPTGVVTPPYDESVVNEVRAAKLEDLTAVMGDFMASRLKFFCDSVDFDHPEVGNTIAQAFGKDSEFNGTLGEMLAFLSLPSGRAMPKVLGLLRESFAKAKSMKEVRQSVYKPLVRSLKTAAAREEARSKKVAKEVGLKEWLEKAKNWHDHPSSFKPFARLNTAHVDDVSANEKKAALMAERGMPSMAASFKKRNEIINSFLGDTHCGFTKVTMVDTAVILAKMHGCQFREDIHAIHYARKAFGKNKFWLEPHSSYPAKNCSPTADEKEKQKERKVTMQEGVVPETFVFKPRAYPLHDFKVEHNQHLKDVLAAAEAHPDMRSKAVFDQFWVIVPGVTLAAEMHHYASRWVVRQNATCELHDTQADAERSLDFWLTGQGAIHPVVLGEVGGKCYFLTMFS